MDFLRENLLRRRGIPGLILRVLGICAAAGAAWAGPYAPAAGEPESTAIHKDDETFTAWATGYLSYNAGFDVDASFQTPVKALGKAVGDSFDIVSLGEGGSIVLTFEAVIGNGGGPDFAVFENSFSDAFLELAYVEVSSDGTTFARFPSDSLTPNPVGGFGTLDPTDVEGLAGKFRQGYGTPFDLSDVAGEPEVVDGSVSLTEIRYVRIVDVVGNGSCLDADGDVIYDPYPTMGSAGFDLEAVGVINTGFENAHAPDKPVLDSPADGAMVELPVTLKTGPFSDADEPGGDSHSRTSWEISPHLDFSEIVTGVTGTRALTELKIFGALLEGAETYYWRARFFDSGSQASEWSDPWCFNTQAPLDTNDNGVPDACDLSPGAVQTVFGDMVLQGADGDSQVALSVSTGGVDLSFAQTMATEDLPLLGGSQPELMPLGVISFRLENVPVGGTAVVKVTLSESAPPGYTYIKYDPAEGWMPFPGAVFSADRREVTLTLQDGGAGDADGTANGGIVDPGGVGYVAVSSSSGGAVAGGSGAGGSAAPPDSDGEAGFGGGGCFLRTLMDEAGRKVSVPDKPRRIVSLAPSITETLFALGLGDRVMGVTEFSTYPPEAATRPKVGSYVNLNAERILGLEPDLVVGTVDGNRFAVVRLLEEAGVPVYAVNPRTVDGVILTVAGLGALCGFEGRGQAVARDLQERLDRVLHRTRVEKRPRVFLQINIQPVMSVGRDTIHHDVIRLAGGENIAADHPVHYPLIKLEEIVGKSPDVILISSMERGGAFEAARRDWLKRAVIPAARSGRVHLIDSDLIDRPSPRVIQGIETIADLLHPR